MRTCARERGLTFIELVAVVAILMLVASAAMPLGKNAVRRGKEVQLRRGDRHDATAAAAMLAPTICIVACSAAVGLNSTTSVPVCGQGRWPGVA